MYTHLSKKYLQFTAVCLTKFIGNQTTSSIVTLKFLELIFSSWSHSLRRYIWGNLRSKWHNGKCLTTDSPKKIFFICCNLSHCTQFKATNVISLKAELGREATTVYTSLYLMTLTAYGCSSKLPASPWNCHLVRCY